MLECAGWALSSAILKLKNDVDIGGSESIFLLVFIIPGNSREVEIGKYD